MVDYLVLVASVKAVICLILILLLRLMKRKGMGEGRCAKAGLETVLAGGKHALGKAAVNQARKRLAGSAGKNKRQV